MNGEGITATPTSVPSLGTLVSDLPFNNNTVTDAYNQIATLSGTIWYIDQNGVLWFNPFTSLPGAPFNLFDDGTFPPTPTSFSNNYRALMIEETSVGYANQVYAVSNLSTVPGSGTGGGGGGGTGTGTNTETFIMTPGNPGIKVDGLGNPYGFDVTQPIGTIYSLTVDGVAQVVVNYAQWSGQEPTAAPQYGPWFWLSDATGISCSLTGAGGLPVGSTVVVNYTPTAGATNTQGAIGAALSPSSGGTCGSGVYQMALQVKNISDPNQLNAIAAAALAKYIGTPKFATFQTDKPGLGPGQIININDVGLDINEDFVITTCQGIYSTGVLEFGSGFQWKVTAQTNQDLGNFVQWYANLLYNASNALPIYQYEDASFAIAITGSLSTGLVTANPYLVKRTGQLVYMWAAALTPPTGQDLVIEFLVNGNVIMVNGAPAQVIIPDSTAPNTPFQYVFPSTNPIWVFNTATQNDVITCQVSYVERSTGAKTAVMNGSAYLRWRM